MTGPFVTRRVVQVDDAGVVVANNETSMRLEDWDAYIAENQKAYGTDFPPGLIEVTDTHTYEESCALVTVSAAREPDGTFTTPQGVKTSSPSKLDAMAADIAAIKAALKIP